LDDNWMTTIPDKALWPLDDLDLLSLGGNNLAKAIIDDGILDRLPTSLVSLSLDNCNFGTVPKRVVSNNQQITFLDLADNHIDTIKSDDFADAVNLESLYLNGNPLKTIKEGAFSKMKNARTIDLKNTFLPEIDLSVFAGTPDHVDVFLDNNSMLTYLTASDWSKMPQVASFQLTSTGLQIVDDKIAGLLNSRPSVEIDISKNAHLLCDGLYWMAYFVECTKTLVIDGTRCVDKSNQPLVEYLKMMVPDPCSSPPSSTTSTTTTTTTTTTSTSTPTTTTTAHGSTNTTTAGTGGTSTTTEITPTTTSNSTETNTTVSAAPTTTKKGAAQVHSRISLIISMGAFVIFFKYLFNSLC